MKKFILHTFLFVLVAVGAIYFIASIEIPEEYIIYKTRGTNYKKIAWNINLIKNNPEKISGAFVFLGPSLTEVGICDSTLQKQGIKAVNLGVNHSGNEIELFFLNKIAHLKPQKAYLNLSKARGEGLHPMTPLLYSPGLLMASGQNINVSFGRFIFKRASFVLDYFLWKFVRENKAIEKTRDYGVIYEDGVYTDEEYAKLTQQEMDSKFHEFADLEQTGFALKGEEKRTGLKFSIIKARRRLMYSYKNSEFIFNTKTQQKFVAQSFEIGKKNGFEVVELYIPAIMDAKINKPFDESFYHKRQTVIVESLKDFSMLDKAENWYNLYHLSKQGAINFTNQLIEQGLLSPAKDSTVLTKRLQ